MGKNRYSEEEAVQKPAGELLHKMGWELVYAYDNEELGAARHAWTQQLPRGGAASLSGSMRSLS